MRKRLSKSKDLAPVEVEMAPRQAAARAAALAEKLTKIAGRDPKLVEKAVKAYLRLAVVLQTVGAGQPQTILVRLGELPEPRAPRPITEKKESKA